MTKFLKVSTIFTNPKERELNFLKKFYEDKIKLHEVIANLLNELFLQDGFLTDKSVLLKPNWVLHALKEDDSICLYTHENFVLVTLEILASKKPSKIIIADAPVQGCQWGKLITPSFLQKVDIVSQKYEVPVTVKDFRKTTFDVKHNVKRTINADELYTIFDLGTKSMLETLSLYDRNPFRITYYDPDRLKESHHPGTHKYCIANDFLQADVVLSLPKVKTHQKTGITCALKNLVGINGDKDYLPHHRIGGSERGGDCYQGRNKLRYLSEIARDIANRNIGNFKYKIWAGISFLLWNLLPKLKTHSLSAGWYGNDTSWRMVMDLNRIAIYGRQDGTISEQPQRELYSLCDGIIGGQGDGPLKPIPLPLGIVSFTNDSAFNDIGMAKLMGFDWEKIFLLRNAKSKHELDDFFIELNSELKCIHSLSELSIKTIPPPGWQNYLSNT